MDKAITDEQGLPRRLEGNREFFVGIKIFVAKGVQGALQYNRSYSKDFDIDDL